jgi:hypothetical protein
MKFLIVGLVAMTSVSAFAGPFSNLKYKFCKGQVTSKDGYSLVCHKALSAADVLAAKQLKKVDRIGVNSYGATEEFGVMPDPDTNSIYRYTSELLNAKGKAVGYQVVTGYHNGEMEYKMQLTQRLNLKGELVSALIKD